MTKTVEERFWEKVGPPTGEFGCREWLACSQQTKGRTARYGLFTYQGTLQVAHRVAWILTIGPIPEGMTLDHIVCDNSICVEPTHLKPTTLRDNVLRSKTSHGAVNARKTHCPKGHPYSGDNLFINSMGRRCCRECSRAMNRSRRAYKAEWWRKKYKENSVG